MLAKREGERCASSALWSRRVSSLGCTLEAAVLPWFWHRCCSGCESAEKSACSRRHRGARRQSLDT
jgi:hypothetical protein